jgi:hypothetical protein
MDGHDDPYILPTLVERGYNNFESKNGRETKTILLNLFTRLKASPLAGFSWSYSQGLNSMETGKNFGKIMLLMTHQFASHWDGVSNHASSQARNMKK